MTLTTCETKFMVEYTILCGSGFMSGIPDLPHNKYLLSYKRWQTARMINMEAGKKMMP